MTKEELTLEVIARLKKEYPLAVCTLDYNDAWKLLVSVRLAAQCTDARVNVVVKDLYAKFPDVDALANAPDDFDALLSLPGVGRKSANLIMGDVFGKPAMVTDTHCIRLVNRIGIVEGIKEPKKVEMVLWKLVPPEEGSDFCHRLVYHGRDVCTARTKPHCERCCLSDICAKTGV